VSASILVADEERNIVLSLEFLLKQAGFRVRTGANPAWRGMRIVMLTAKGGEIQREKGLSLGADDT
jgi:DNA-binding response OmpR family regulator